MFSCKTFAFPRETLQWLAKHLCSVRNFAFACKTIVFPQETLHSLTKLSFSRETLSSLAKFVFPQETPCSLAKLRLFPEKLWVHLQNVRVSYGNFAFVRKTLPFPKETLSALTKHLHFLEKLCLLAKFCCFPEKLCIRSQNVYDGNNTNWKECISIYQGFCERTQSFLRKRNTVARECKNILSGHKASWGKAIHLGVNATFAVLLWECKST